MACCPSASPAVRPRPAAPARPLVPALVLLLSLVAGCGGGGGDGPRVLAQALHFDAAPVLSLGGTATVKAYASSGLAVAYSSQTPALCSVSADGVVQALGAGTCTIAADQSGDERWAIAVQATLSFTITGLAQTLAFGDAPTLSVGGSAALSASVSSGLAPLLSSLSPAVCGVDAATATVTGLAAGTCTVAADQPGDRLWEPAPQVQQQFEVRRRSQSLAFDAAPALALGGTATVSARASSGLAPRYASQTPSVCSVDAASGLVSGRATGACVLSADQTGDATWDAAPTVTLTLAVGGRAQSIAFGAAPALMAGGSATVRAVASSGLAVRYGSVTPTVCSVQAASGVVTALLAGTCRISADQDGDASWAAAAQQVQTITVTANPAQSISFAAAPTLVLGGSATVSATASSGLAVSYSSLTPTVCSVQAASGLVSALALGDCLIAADQAGNASYYAAARVTQTLPVQPASGTTVPGTPSGVAATLGTGIGSVIVSITGVASGGVAVSGYLITSEPAGVSASVATMPATLACPGGSCVGHAFKVAAVNALGTGPASSAASILTSFDVLLTFREPDTQPRDTVFTGSFTLNSTTGEVLNLSGNLTESMTGNAIGSAPYYDMTQVALTNALLSWRDGALGGRFAASFAKATTSTFTTAAGGDGWSPPAGVDSGGLYAGYPAAYAGTVKNSYVLIFVPDNPFAALSAAQLAKLAYADCAPGGMMGAVCMTGTSAAGYGAVGTMSGYPVSQVLTRR